MRDELRRGLGVGRLPVLVLGGVLAILIVIPIAVVVSTSWTAGQLLEFPPQGFSTQWYEKAFEGPTWTDPFMVSLSVSVRAATIATVMGTAAALGVRRITTTRGKAFVRAFFIMPLTLPYVAYALGMYNLFLYLPESWAQTTWPLVLSQAIVTLPLSYIVVTSALSGVDPRLAPAASTLGARWPTILWRVELPLIRPALLGGWIFCFVSTFDEATLAIFLAPIDQSTFAQQLYRSAAESIEPTLSAVSVMTTLAAAVVLILGSLVARRTTNPLEARA